MNRIIKWPLFISIFLLLLTLPLVNACKAQTPSVTSPTASSPSVTSPAGPIKMGFISSFTGPYAQSGLAGQEGSSLAVDAINNAGGLLGRQVQLFSRDDGGSATTAVQVAEELHSKYGVNLFFTESGSGTCIALSPKMVEMGCVLLTCSGHSTAITGVNWSPNTFRITDNAQIRNYAMVGIVQQKFPNAKKWATVSDDTAYGHSCWDQFVAKFKASDPAFQSVSDRWAPFGAASYAPYISAVIAAQPDGIYTSLAASEMILFIREGKAYGLFNKAVLVCNNTEFTDAEALGKDNVPYWAGVHYYSGASNNPESQNFQATFAAKYGSALFYDHQCHSANGYDGVNTFKAAIQKAGTDDPQALIKTFQDFSFKSPKGDILIRSGDNQAILPITFIHFSPTPNQPYFTLDDCIQLKGADYILPVADARKL
jgi:branched-chain amino acid transport system substrate-binding protein